MNFSNGVHFGNEEIATKRRKIGFTRKLQALRDIQPHPSKGGCRGYDFHFRVSEVEKSIQGLNTIASKRSLRRWKNRRITPYRMTGNHELNTIVGNHLLLMVQFIYLFPEAEDDEIIAYIFNNTGKLYDRSQVCRRRSDINITRKRASTEANGAYTARNQLRHDLFWSQPPPLGVAGVNRRRYIDFDECGFDLVKVNRKYGCAIQGVRVLKPGHYTKTTNVTVILGVEPGDPRVPPGNLGSINNPRKWLRINVRRSTNADEFNNYLEYVMDDLQNNPIPNIPNEGRIFLWDNLSAHLTPLIYNTVAARNAGHTIVPRPPYRPWIAPIEYVFCQLACELRRRFHLITDTAILINEIQNIIPTLKGINATYTHCGYQ